MTSARDGARGSVSAPQPGTLAELGTERLDQVVSSIGAGLSLLDRDLRIVWVNRIVEEMFGPRENLIGRHCYELYHCHSRPCTRCAAREAMTTRRVARDRHVHRAESGEERCVRVTAAPVLDDAGEVVNVLELVQDCTAEHRLQQRARQAENLAILGRIAASIAHEVGNPLTGMSSILQLLRERSPDDPSREMLDIALTQVDRMIGILRQVRDLARPPEPRGTTTRLLDPARRVVAALTADGRFRDRTVALVEPDGDEPVIETDPALLEQILLNVGLNALQATPPGGRVTLAMMRRGFREGTPHCIAVEDEGPGVATELRERIFDPFFSTKRAGEGTGLGLYVSRTLATVLGGWILAEPHEPAGARFSVFLPERLPQTEGGMQLPPAED